MCNVQCASSGEPTPRIVREWHAKPLPAWRSTAGSFKLRCQTTHSKPHLIPLCGSATAPGLYKVSSPDGVQQYGISVTLLLVYKK